MPSRPLLRLAVLAACLTPLGLADAQAGSAPTLIATVFVGEAPSQSLWEIGHQPLCLTNKCSVHDTLDLTRKPGTTFLGGLAVSYFPVSPHVGAEAEVSLGFRSLVDRCVNVAPYAADSIIPGRNQEICRNLGSSSHSLNTVSFYLGLVARASTAATVSPFFRLGAGVETLSTSTLAVTGEYPVGGVNLADQAVIVDSTPKSVTLSWVVAAGLTVQAGSYLARFEISDRTESLERPTGPASDTGIVPSESHLYHNLTVSLGLGFALNRTHGKRY